MGNIDKNTAGENPKADVQKMSSLLKKGFSIILVLIILLALVNIFQLQKTKQLLNNLVSTNIQKMALSSIMLDSIRRRTIILYKMLETEDYFARYDELDKLYTSARHFREAREKTIALGVQVVEKNINNKILKQLLIVQPMARDAAESMLSNIPHAELKIKVQNVVNHQEKLYKLLIQLNSLHESQSNQALKDININFTYTIILTVLVTVLVIFLTLRIAKRLFLHVINTSNILANKNIELEKAYIKSEESTKIKSEFIAKISHETRTPLNGIMGMIQLLKTTNLNDEQKDYSDTALSSSNDLLAIIDNILDFSKMESGSLNIDITSFNLTSIINDVVSIYEKTAHDKNITLIQSIQSNVKKQYLGDSVRISQILMNLVDNAIKFTSKGEVTINVFEHETNPDSSILYFEVRDTGMGIPDEVKENLFTAFNQADNTIERNYDGAGLGLSICKELVALMDGDIGIENGKNGGSIFWFTLKFAHVKA